MHTTIELPEALYDKARRVAGLKGISVQEFITDILEEKLFTASTPGGKKRISLPLVPSSHPGARALTAERTAELLSDDDVSH